jgi:hypothetical protein
MLSHIATLTNLYICESEDITYEGLSHLSNLVLLRKLALWGCNNITDKSAAEEKFDFPIDISVYF